MITPSLVEKIGWYTVGNNVYYAKSEALAAAGGVKNRVQWHFNDQVFAHYDWTREPEPHLGIDEFYRRRAQQLRDKYDYLVLLYSGGSDSENILHTFVDNDIFIDEIVNANSYQRTGVEQGTIHNADYVHNVKPTLERFQTEKNLRSRITILDEIDICKQHIARHQLLDHAEVLIEQGSISSFFYRPHVLRYLPHVWEKVIGGAKVGLIVGSDKPKVSVKDRRWSVNFYDALVGNYGLTALNDPDLKFMDSWEFFYWSPDAVDLIIKQCHVLKNFMTACQDPQYYTDEQGMKWSSQQVENSRAAYTCESKHLPGMHLNYHTYHKLIYPKLDLKFVTHKSSGSMFRNDMFWFTKIRNTDGQFLQQTIRDWLKRNPQYINPQEVQKGSWPVFVTEPIYIE